MATQEVAQSVRVKFREAPANASCWRESARIYEGYAAGPYVTSFNKEEGRWEVWWSNAKSEGVAALHALEANALATMRRLAAKWAEIKDRKVYFIGRENKVGEMVKIGIAFEPTKRLANLQTAWPFDLRILAQRIGDADTEKAYHKRFQRSRLRGEWFKITPAIKAEIELYSN